MMSMCKNSIAGTNQSLVTNMRRSSGSRSGPGSSAERVLSGSCHDICKYGTHSSSRVQNEARKPLQQLKTATAKADPKKGIKKDKSSLVGDPKNKPKAALVVDTGCSFRRSSLSSINSKDHLLIKKDKSSLVGDPKNKHKATLVVDAGCSFRRSSLSGSNSKDHLLIKKAASLDSSAVIKREVSAAKKGCKLRPAQVNPVPVKNELDFNGGVQKTTQSTAPAKNELGTQCAPQVTPTNEEKELPPPIKVNAVPASMKNDLENQFAPQVSPTNEGKEVPPPIKVKAVNEVGTQCTPFSLEVCPTRGGLIMSKVKVEVETETCKGDGFVSAIKIHKERPVKEKDTKEYSVQKETQKRGKRASWVIEESKRLQFRKGGGMVRDKGEEVEGRRLKFRKGGTVKGKGEEEESKRLEFRKGRMVKEKVRAKNDVEKVSLKHQELQEKKQSEGLLNNVIEATATKLVKTRKGKVKALVEAFETVISIQHKNLPSFF